MTRLMLRVSSILILRSETNRVPLYIYKIKKRLIDQSSESLPNNN